MGSPQKRSKIPIEFSDAVRAGYIPCSVYSPPTLDEKGKGTGEEETEDRH